MIIGFLFVLLVGVRFFENSFYDPLLSYFKYDYLHTSFPDVKMGKLFLNLFLRYTINTLISLGIIWVAFQKKSYLKFSLYFYGIAFMVLILLFYLVLQTNLENYYLIVFYIRRFLIQPIFVLLLLPAFYYQDRFK